MPGTETEFDRYADEYHHALHQGLRASGEDASYFARNRIAYLKACLDQLSIQPRTVLDYGCGVGTAVPLLLELIDPERVIGVDVSTHSLEVARQECQGLPVEFLLNDDYDKSEEVDLAYCNGVFHHIVPGERAQAIRYISDKLRPKGLFALWENNPWNPGTRYVMSKIPFDQDAIPLFPGETRRLGESVGLKVLHTSFRFVFPRALAWMRGTERGLAALPLGAQYQVVFAKD